jgi:hypothetical protein
MFSSGHPQGCPFCFFGERPGKHNFPVACVLLRSAFYFDQRFLKNSCPSGVVLDTLVPIFLAAASDTAQHGMHFPRIHPSFVAA